MPHLSRKGRQNFLRIVRPFVQELAWRLTRQHGDARHPRWHSALLRQGGPRTILFVLGNAEGIFARMTERRAIELARHTPEHIDQDQAYGSANGRVGPIAVGQHVVRGIHAKGRTDGTVHHDELRAASRARSTAVQVERLLAHGLKNGHHDRHIRR